MKITLSYTATAVVLWVGLLFQTLQYQWSSDFWVHVAAIQEFLANPLEPSHPFLPLRLPHYSLSAYHWLVARLGDIPSVSSIQAAQVAGMINATGILILLPRFVRVFVTHRSAPLVALLLTLLAWGPGAWRYSSFLNLNSIGFGLPYPSYFAIWASFLLIILFAGVIDRERVSILEFIGLASLGFVIANAHLITFGSMLVLAAALTLARRSKSGSSALATAAGGALFGALAWPFFNQVSLLLDLPAGVDQENRPMYERTFVRVGPALVGWFPLVQLAEKTRDALVLACAALTAIFGAGLLFEIWTLGRVLPFLVLVLHLALTRWILAIWQRSLSSRRKLLTGVGGVTIAIFLVLASSGLVRMIPFGLLPDSMRDDPRLSTPIPWLIQASDFIQHGDVVLAPRSLSTYFPAIGGKTVAIRDSPFIEDEEARARVVEAFFEEPNPLTIMSYQVDWIAFNPEELSSTTVAELRSWGRVAYSGDIELIRLADE